MVVPIESVRVFCSCNETHLKLSKYMAIRMGKILFYAESNFTQNLAFNLDINLHTLLKYSFFFFFVLLCMLY